MALHDLETAARSEQNVHRSGPIQLAEHDLLQIAQLSSVELPLNLLDLAAPGVGDLRVATVDQAYNQQPLHFVWPRPQVGQQVRIGPLRHGRNPPRLAAIQPLDRALQADQRESGQDSAPDQESRPDQRQGASGR